MNPRPLTRSFVNNSALLAIIGALISLWIGRETVAGRGAFYLLLVAGTLAVVAVARWPSFPIVVYYPLTWIFWSYHIPGIGKPERLTGMLAILGMLVMILLKHNRLPALPPIVTTGLSLVLGGYLVSAWINPLLSSTLEYVVSLFARVILLYLVYFHLRTRNQLRYAVQLYLVAAVAVAALTFVVSLVYSFEFSRIPSQGLAIHQSLGLILTRAIESVTLAGPAGLLVLGFYPVARNRRQRLATIVLALFIFWMAFVSSLRREILLSVPLTLIFLTMERSSRIRRVAAWVLLISMALFFLVVLPSSTVVQHRLQDETETVLSGAEPRIRNFRAELIAISRSPLLGYGPGAHALAIAPFVSPGSHFLSGYNSFGWIAVEAGIFGLIGFVLVLLGTYIESRKSLQVEASGIEAWVLRCAPVLLLQIVLWSSFGNAWQLSMPWFLMGVILSAARLARTGSRPMV